MKYYEMNKRFKNNLQKAHDKFISKNYSTFDEAYKVLNSYKSFQELEEYVIDYIIDTIMEAKGNEETTYLVDDTKIVKIEENVKLIKAEDLKENDIILSYEYTLQVNETINNQFNGTFQKTFETEMKVIRVKLLDNGKVSTMLENKAHCIGKKYDKNEIIEIK